MDAARPRNAFLRAISAEDWLKLKPDLQDFPLVDGDVLTDIGDNIGWVVFPETGLVSVISILISGDAVETGVVGRDGAVSFIEALGSGIARNRLLVQVPGKAVRARSDAFTAAFWSSPAMQYAVHHQIELVLAEAHLAIACRSLHNVEQRLCRLLLECDALSGNVTPLPLTQKLLSVMLAVQRTTVAKFASALQDDGLIRYRRGTVRIVNREGLGRRSCTCRATLVNLRARLPIPPYLPLPSL